MLANTEIRNLREGTLDTLIQILHIVEDDWKKFMSFIPMDPQKENSERKYNSEHVRLIEEHSRIIKEKCAKILFDEWGTSGQIRPTLRTVQQIALKAEMMRLADEIANMLKEPLPPRPTQGPGAPVTDISLLLKETSSELRDTTAQMRSVNDQTRSDENQEGREYSANIPNWQIILGKPQSNHQFSDNQESSQYSEPVSSDQSTDDQADSVIHNESVEPQECNNQYPFAQAHRNQQLDQNTSDSQLSNYQQSLPNIAVFQKTTEGLSLTGRIDSTILQDSNLIHFDYQELEAITKNFGETFKIGHGGFGEVFKAPHPSHGHLAIKKTHAQFQQKQEVVIKIFNSEVRFLSQFRHENIVPILGFSKNGPVPCIVCDYIEGGSLQEKIAQKVLNQTQRITIMRGTAEGLRYLHSNLSDRPGAPTASDPSAQSVSKTNFVHGDVKSANILLTKDYIPKLCDFGLAKQYEHTFVVHTVVGTAVYMAPEALSGTVTQKSDIYSYGVVLLELLTGLAPLIRVDDAEVDIKTHVNESMRKYGMSMFDLLDQSTQWTRAGEIFLLANKCLESDRHERPTSAIICNILNAFNDY